MGSVPFLSLGAGSKRGLTPHLLAAITTTMQQSSIGRHCASKKT